MVQMQDIHTKRVIDWNFWNNEFKNQTFIEYKNENKNKWSIETYQLVNVIGPDSAGFQRKSENFSYPFFFCVRETFRHRFFINYYINHYYINYAL